MRIAGGTAGEFGHHAARFHAARQHMAVVAVRGDHLIAWLQGKLHADHHRLLADIQMAEPADQAHAVELAGLLLEAADLQHIVIGFQQQVLVGGRVTRLAPLGGRLCHGDLPWYPLTRGHR